METVTSPFLRAFFRQNFSTNEINYLIDKTEKRKPYNIQETNSQGNQPLLLSKDVKRALKTAARTNNLEKKQKIGALLKKAYPFLSEKDKKRIDENRKLKNYIEHAHIFSSDGNASSSVERSSLSNINQSEVNKAKNNLRSTQSSPAPNPISASAPNLSHADTHQKIAGSNVKAKVEFFEQNKVESKQEKKSRDDTDGDNNIPFQQEVEQRWPDSRILTVGPDADMKKELIKMSVSAVISKGEDSKITICTHSGEKVIFNNLEEAEAFLKYLGIINPKNNSSVSYTQKNSLDDLKKALKQNFGDKVIVIDAELPSGQTKRNSINKLLAKTNAKAAVEIPKIISGLIVHYASSGNAEYFKTLDALLYELNYLRKETK